MKNCLIIAILAITISFGFSQISFAVCVEGPPDTFTCNTNPPNPDLMGVQPGGNNDFTVNVLPGAGIDTRGQPGDLIGINTNNGEDNITVTDGEVRAEDTGIDTGNDNDTVTVDNSTIESITDVGIDTGNNNDTVTVMDSTVISGDDAAINTGSGGDIITVTGSTLIGLVNDGESFHTLNTGNGNDRVTVSETVIIAAPSRASINLGNNNDTLTLGSGVDLNRIIDCGDGFDTITFAMAVPDDLLGFLTNRILQLDPAGDSIRINGLFYEWIDCELLVPDLTGGAPRMVRPIPTLSEWGMIAMAGVLGIVALIAVRRRAAADA